MYVATSIGEPVLLISLMYEKHLCTCFPSAFGGLPAPNLLTNISSRRIDRKRLAGDLRTIAPSVKIMEASCDLDGTEPVFTL